MTSDETSKHTQDAQLLFVEDADDINAQDVLVDENFAASGITLSKRREYHSRAFILGQSLLDRRREIDSDAILLGGSWVSDIIHYPWSYSGTNFTGGHVWDRVEWSGTSQAPIVKLVHAQSGTDLLSGTSSPLVLSAASFMEGPIRLVAIHGGQTMTSQQTHLNLGWRSFDSLMGLARFQPTGWVQL